MDTLLLVNVETTMQSVNKVEKKFIAVVPSLSGLLPFLKPDQLGPRELECVMQQKNVHLLTNYIDIKKGTENACRKWRSSVSDISIL